VNSAVRAKVRIYEKKKTKKEGSKGKIQVFFMLLCPDVKIDANEQHIHSKRRVENMGREKPVKKQIFFLG